MNVLVTAGNTQAPIDKVRCLTNIFTGRTGANIAAEARARGHNVTLVTSHPDTIADADVAVETYRTFDDLYALLERHVRGGRFGAIVHAAAVGDYRSAGIFAPDDLTYFDETTGAISGTLLDRAAGKVKSDEPELWLRLTRTPKIVDLFRGAWGFAGTLVKFKLEVDKSEAELVTIAERSRRQSRADLMVANTLEGAVEWALIGPVDGRYERIARGDLARRVVDFLGPVSPV